MRFYDVDKGRIEVSGVDIQKMQRKTLRRCMVWCRKPGSLKEQQRQIVYGKEDATEDDYWAAKASCS